MLLLKMGNSGTRRRSLTHAMWEKGLPNPFMCWEEAGIPRVHKGTVPLERGLTIGRLNPHFGNRCRARFETLLKAPRAGAASSAVVAEVVATHPQLLPQSS